MSVRSRTDLSFPAEGADHWVSLAASSLNLLKRETVALAVTAAGVLKIRLTNWAYDSYQAPPAMVFLHPLHLQMPTALLLMASY